SLLLQKSSRLKPGNFHHHVQPRGIGQLPDTMASNRNRRIAKEIADIHNDSHSQVTAEPVGADDDLTHLRGSFRGPPGTPYEDGTFFVDIKIPTEYPFRPPVMKFETKVYHPNISSQTGAICLDTLSSAWSPVLTIKSALLSLQSLLSTPEPKDPQDAEVANMLLRKPKEFERLAREWAINFAGAPKKQVAEGSGGATDASIREQERKAKEDEERDAIAAYDGYNKDLIDRFCSMGFDLDRVIAAFNYVGIDRNDGEDYELEGEYLGDITAHLLAKLRSDTNATACERLRAAQQRAREDPRSGTPSTTGNSTPNPTSDNETKWEAALERDVDCLTPEEELTFLRYFCEQALELGDKYKPALPTMIRATAIQFLRRFYLTNSVMTYHPKTMMPCALFLATKTDNYFISLNSFSKEVPKIEKPDDIIAPEYTLTQGLRFTFDVRHPFRGLEGGVMELQAIALGEGRPAPHSIGQTAESMKEAIHSIAPLSASDRASASTRILNAHGKAREILKTAAQMTDVYFHYTPSQIWLSAFFLVDEPLARFYIDTKLGPENSYADANNPLVILRTKLLNTLSECSQTLGSYIPLASNPDMMIRLRAIAKKVYQCEQVEKLDPGAPESGQKRVPGAEGASESEMDRTAKKRRLEREKREREGKDVFGGELVTQRSRAPQE
ncbi:uncharacterized protein TRUGW13939_08163, partial [Talaromyces rugulosus]